LVCFCAFGLTAEAIGEPADEEWLKHYNWTYEQAGETNKSLVKKWPFKKEIKSDFGKTITFQHYGIDKQTNWFKDVLRTPNRSDLDELFKELNSNFVFYGHNHKASDIQGNSRYVNLGSAGSYYKPEVRLGILDLSQEELVLEKHAIRYDDTGLMEEFEKKQVPARSIVKNAFKNKVD